MNNVNNDKVHFIGCGGGGIAIAKHVKGRVEATKDAGTVETEFLYVDLSTNSVPTNDNSSYIIPALGMGEDSRGAGGDRGSVVETVVAGMDGLISHFGFNKLSKGDTVILSLLLSGGAGSVIGPLLLSELKNLGVNVMVFCVGDSGSLIEADSTLKTMKTLKNIATKNSVTISYHDNFIGQSKVNSDISDLYEKLQIFMSGVNHDLDSADIAVAFNHDTYKGGILATGLYILDIRCTSTKFTPPGSMVFLRILTETPLSTKTNFEAVHLKIGSVVKGEVSLKVQGKSDPLILFTIVGGMDSIIENMAAGVKVTEDRLKNLGISEEPVEDFMVI